MTKFRSLLWSFSLVSLFWIASVRGEQCLTSDEIEFTITGTLDGPDADSCCQNHICGLPCAKEVPAPAPGYAIAMGVSVVISFIVGMLTYFCVNGESENYFLAGRSLPLWMVAVTLAAASVDSNALLGNADLSFKYHFWDGGMYYNYFVQTVLRMNQ